MAQTIAVWLDRLFSYEVRAVPLPSSSDRKHMEIEVERLPDYRWRELGFAPARRSGWE